MLQRANSRARTSSLSDSSQEVSRDRLISLDDNIVPLTTANIQPLSLVRHDRHKVSSNDCHLMIVEMKRIDILNSRVDEAEQVLLSWLNLPQCVLASRAIDGTIGAVEEVVGAGRDAEMSNSVGLLERRDGEGVVDHDGAHV